MKPCKEHTDQLDRDCIQIHNGRAQLKEQVKQLQALNQQQAKKLRETNITVGLCMERIADLHRASKLYYFRPATTTPSGVQLPTHQEMGGHIRLPTVSGPIPSSMATPNSLSVPPVLTLIGSLTPGMTDISTPTLPRLTHLHRNRRMIWTLSPRKGQSPDSRAAPGTQQSSPVAPCTPLIFMRRKGQGSQSSRQP